MQLENQLSKSKEETARWFIKYEAINRELQLVRQALERQTKVNRQLIEQNKNIFERKEPMIIPTKNYFFNYNG